MKNLSNGRRTQAGIHFGVHAQQILAALALREIFADEISQMLDMKPAHALFHITVDTALITIARLTAAADQNQCLENLRMIESQLKPHHAANADAGED